jgi:3-keto-5-aminohexanoate cleavage enzyme
MAFTPVVICVAPNGARRNKSDHARLPMSAQELAAEARACQQSGATAIHLHVRDAQGRHSLDPVLYRDAINAIEAATAGNMVVQITTEAVGIFTPAQQIETVMAVCPEAVSVAVRELVPDTLAEAAAGRFYAWAQAKGVGMQHVLYDANDVKRAVALQASGVIPQERPHVLLVLGRYAKNLTSDPSDLTPMLQVLPPDWPWSLCAFGMTESRCMQAAIERGGNCRVGFENNLQLEQGGIAAGNADLVAQVSEAAKRSERQLGGIEDARALYVG